MSPTTKTTLLDLFDLGSTKLDAFVIETGRSERSRRILGKHKSAISSDLEDWTGLDGRLLGWHSACPSESDGSKYEVSTEIARNEDGTEIDVRLECGCESWKTGKMFKPQQPCKHLLAFAALVVLPAELRLSKITTITTPNAFEGSATATPAKASAWQEKISAGIGNAVLKVANSIWVVLQSGNVPLVIGPTGCGKTSAARLVATDFMSGALVEHSGADSWSDSDLVGFVHANGERFPGPVAKACDMARFEGNTLLFLDEFTRYNRRVQDGLMNFVLPTPNRAAKAMGYDTDEPIHRAMAPFWGETWAPVSMLKLVLACNPWGTEIDPALVRRTEPVMVDFDPDLALMLAGKLRDAVSASWRATADGSLPLPIEYQALSQTTGPEDLTIVGRYVRRLQVLDPAAAEGYLAVLAGLKIKPEDIGIKKPVLGAA